MCKFPATPEGFYQAMEWAKTIPHENGKTLSFLFIYNEVILLFLL